MTIRLYMASRMLELRYPGKCERCSRKLPVGSHAWWDTNRHTVTCLNCRASALGQSSESALLALDRGQAGASAAREYERRKRKRQHRTREAHPWIGRGLLALNGTPQHEAAFQRGERGELAVAASLEKWAARGASIVLHDRRMPNGHGNIDHLAVAPTGVLVIDAKDIKGRVRVKTPLSGAPKLMIAGRNRTRLVAGVERQMSAVRDALASSGRAEIRVCGFLCFTKADLPLLGRRKIGGCELAYRRAVARKLNARGPLSPSEIEALAESLAAAFPRA
jgi:hypothetical protein